MRILQTQVLRGANLWAPMPVIRFSLESGGLGARFTNVITDFYEKLTAMFPALREHECSTGARFIDCVREGTCLAHVVQHVALEMQHMAGQKVDEGRTCLAIDLDDEATSTGHVVFRYEQQDVG